jgi:hypothetical protein
MLAVNGYDGIGHYLRAGLQANLCTSLTASFQATCNARFSAGASSSSTSASKDDLKPLLAKEPPAGKRGQGSVPPQGDILGGLLGAGQTPEGKRNVQRIKEGAKRGSPALQGNEEPMLDYLLGSDR